MQNFYKVLLIIPEQGTMYYGFWSGCEVYGLLCNSFFIGINTLAFTVPKICRTYSVFKFCFNSHLAIFMPRTALPVQGISVPFR